MTDFAFYYKFGTFIVILVAILDLSRQLFHEMYK